MNKRIRSLIDDIFAEMKMTAENLALRDELMANAQARYEDAVAQGKSEEEAFAEVAASLGDVRALLSDMNDGAQTAEPKAEEAAQTDKAAEDKQEFDLGGALNSVFSALGDLGRSVMPQAKKLVRDVDQATGGMVKDVGRAVNQGMRDAQRAAGEALERINRRDAQDAPRAKPVQSAQELRETARDLRAQASLKRVTGDAENADVLERQAEALETQADAQEQAAAMEQAGREAQEQAEKAQDEAERAQEQAERAQDEAERAQDEAERVQEQAEDAQNAPLCGEDGEIDEDSFAEAVEDIARDAERLAGEAADRVRECVQKMGGGEPVENMRLTQHFPVAGLRSVDVKLDADDVVIEPRDAQDIEVCWEAEKALSVPDVHLEGHTLVVRRANPDVFKTFFSVFKKDGGTITVRVPRGYAADYSVNTTSGHIALRGVDVEDLHVGTTSGMVRLEPDAAIRAGKIEVSSVSGAVTISASAQELEVSSVSGEQFISCDAGKADVNTVSGRMHLEGACDDLEVSSVSGPVEIVCTVVPARRIKMDTVSAGARVLLPGDVRGFAASVSGMNASIVNEFGPDRYGTCALPIHMDSLSGQLSIARL